MHYLDNAATTAVDKRVQAVVCSVLEEHFANPSSLYEPGMNAELVIGKARAQLATALGAVEKEVVFTGSGSEGNNMAVLGAVLARKGWANHIVATGYEHPSVQKPLELLEKEFGLRVTLVPPDKSGRVDAARLVEAVGPKTALVACMQVNNEVGTVLDVAAIAAAVKAKNSRTAVHVDGVQGFTKQPLALGKTQIDSYAVSGHKLHAPKGVGALYLRSGYNFTPPYTGGGQENNQRPGTENTAFIAGFGEAVARAVESHEADAETVRTLHERLTQGLAGLPDVEINSPPEAWPGIVNLSLPGIRSETMLHYLAARGVYLSAGSACSSGQPSHTLTAMGLKPKRITSALRISFDGTNTQADIDALLKGLADGLATLARGRVGQRR